jgi:hypothetical protein
MKSEFESAASDLGLENDPLIAALSRLLKAQDEERERNIYTVNGLVPERRAQKVSE